jgi:hypothetical protein
MPTTDLSSQRLSPRDAIPSSTVFRKRRAGASVSLRSLSVAILTPTVGFPANTAALEQAWSLFSLTFPFFGACRASVKYEHGRSEFVPRLRVPGIGGASRIEQEAIG